MLIRLSVDEVMWCRQQSVNHQGQGLLCNLHCAATVVLREQLNFKSAVITSERSSCLLHFFLHYTREALTYFALNEGENTYNIQ